jgi:class 3 adenylate cyclase
VRPYAFISEVYLESGDLESAIEYAEVSYELEGSKTDQQKDEIALIQATKVLSKALAMKEDYKKAHLYLDRFNVESNRFAKGSVKQKVADMQSMFEFEQEMNLQKLRQQKDKEIAEQQIAKERVLRNSFLIGFALLLLLLGVLYNRFNLKKRANRALRELNEVITVEKKRSDELLLNILPEEIAEELKEKGHSDAQLIDHVTVLFTDFKGFTSMAEQVSAKELVHDLNICFSEFDQIVEKYGIEKIKTIGDAYMAAGGLPLPDELHAEHVIRAAFEMRDFIESGKARKIETGLPYFEIRIGIHTGPVVAGIVGVRKFQYDIWGDTVNTASRMESSGEVGEVNISEATYELVKDNPEFRFSSRGKVQAKGKGEMEMYFVS